VSLAFYRIAREALNNIIKHTQAAQIRISVFQAPERIEMRIQDDGFGFDPQTVPAGHLGISIMTERAEQIGGDLWIESIPGQGTEVVVTWPGNRRESREYE
jgi:signal transduction histidine kinase